MVTPKRKQAGVENTPAVMPKRALQKHNNYEEIDNFSATLDSVSVSLSSTTSAHQYSLPDLEGEMFRTIRRYGLILSRYGLINKPKFAKKYGFPLMVVETACRIVANYAYQEVFASDPTIGTTHLQPLQQALSVPMPSDKAIMAAMAYVGTDPFISLMTTCDTPLYTLMQEADQEIRNDYQSHEFGGLITPSRLLTEVMKFADTPHKYNQKRYELIYKRLCVHLNHILRAMAEAREQARTQPKPTDSYPSDYGDGDDDDDSDIPGNGKPRVISEGGMWAKAILSKPELAISHTGKAGRRIIAANQGKYVKYLERTVTDPHQRIFSRKTRSLGGVVVVDCSGSMSLTADEMTSIMKASAGCTVIAYSDDNKSVGRPNIWVVANRGRQVRHLPKFPGGNGVDGPALLYGISLRTCNAPIVWISDCQVTGASGHSYDELQKVCFALCNKHNIHIAPDCASATTLLSKLQRGERVIRKPKRED